MADAIFCFYVPTKELDGSTTLRFLERRLIQTGHKNWNDILVHVCKKYKVPDTWVSETTPVEFERIMGSISEFASLSNAYCGNCPHQDTSHARTPYECTRCGIYPHRHIASRVQIPVWRNTQPKLTRKGIGICLSGGIYGKKHCIQFL